MNLAVFAARLECELDPALLEPHISREGLKMLAAQVAYILLDTMGSGDSATCSFQVQVDSAAAWTVIADDMESGGGLWTATHASGSSDWALGTDNAHSSANAWFAPDVFTSSDQYLTLANPVEIIGDAILRFWHDYDTEANWDGGVVEISVNGGEWTDLGDSMFKNGYNSTINANPASAIEGRGAFSGDSGGYVETLVDLSSNAGNTVQIRFRMATDGLEAGVGWYVDDVEILDDALIFNEACVSSSEGDNYCDAIRTTVTPAPVSPTPRIVVNPGSLSAAQSPDVTTSQVLNIVNTGGADLNWDIETCDNPDNGLLWASAEPFVGTTPPAGSVAVTVTFDSTNLAVGEYSGALCVYSNDPDPDASLVEVPLSLTVAEPVALKASGEYPAKGSVTGDYTNTEVDDGTSEVITEQHQGGRPAKRSDALEHVWIFDLEYGNDVTFNANIFKTGDAGDDESFRLSYSRDNVIYGVFHTVGSGASSNLINIPLNLPTAGQGPGPLYIKVEDTDRTSGNNNNESVAVDYLSVTEDTSGNPPPEPPPEPPSNIVMIVDSLGDESVLSSRRNRWNAIVRVTVIEDSLLKDPVVGAVVHGSWFDGGNSSGTCTTDDSGQCSIIKANLKLSVGQVNFILDNVSHLEYSCYESTGETPLVVTAP